MFKKNNWKSVVMNYYNDKFYKLNDNGHGTEHVSDVYLEMLRLNVRLKLNLSDEIMFMTACVHDIFVCTDRKNHHTLAKDYVLNSSDSFLEALDNDERWVIAQAVNEHRASGVDKYSNDYSRILRLADKGIPDLNKIVMRSYWFNKEKYYTTDAICEIAKLVTSHLWTKYDRDGYAFNSEDYKEVYKDELEEFWLSLDGINSDGVLSIIEKGLKGELEYI